MRSSFSRIFFPAVVVLLTALLAVGLFFQIQVRRLLLEQTYSRLEDGAQTVARLAAAYAGEEDPSLDQFAVSFSAMAQASQTDGVICDAQGTILLCANAPLGCEHQGLTLSQEHLQKVMKQGLVRSSGQVEGLYPETRHTVSLAIWEEQTFLGVVLLSTPTADTALVLTRMSNIYLLTAVIVILFAMLLMWYFVHRHSNPLNQMAQAARDFAHGKLSARVPVEEHGPREIQELTLAFNNMAASLEKNETLRQEFVANVSHELKTPMTTISGFVDGILDGTIPESQQSHYLRLVSEETKRLSRLVRSMLDISRLQEQDLPEEKKLRFDIGETLGRSLITFERKILEKALEVKAELPEYPVYTRADPDAITQVVYNLLDNAVKFCPQGGSLGLSVRTGGQKIYVSIENSGPTIPAQELSMVFDRFHKLDKSRSQNRDGWGLGLYIVKTILCGHGEDISVTSREGITRFTFTLPFVN